VDPVSSNGIFNSSARRPDTTEANVRRVPITAGVVITTALVLAPLTQAAAQPHVVKRGETLSSIARSHRVSLGSLTAANSLRNPHALRPGQRLVIPGSQTPRQAVDSRTPSRATTHVVKPRETLSKIASRYRVSMRELAAVNAINNPDALQRGQRLVIPGPETRTVLPPLRVVGASAIPSRPKMGVGGCRLSDETHGCALQMGWDEPARVRLLRTYRLCDALGRRQAPSNRR